MHCNLTIWRLLPALFIFSGLFVACQSVGREDNKWAHTQNPENMQFEQDSIKPLPRTEQEWKDQLSGLEFKVLREKGTERAFTGEYWDHFEKGSYLCRGCGLELFDSDTKFDAHCGWPSFYEAVNSKNIKTADDYLLGYRRVELMCARCGGHLGHVFEDGPEPTGLRYCINSVSIQFKEETGSESK